MELKLNIDGIPISSTKGQFWPILCQFERSEPLVVGLNYDYSKPDFIESFLCKFVDELKTVLESGIMIENR